MKVWLYLVGAEDIFLCPKVKNMHIYGKDNVKVFNFV